MRDNLRLYKRIDEHMHRFLPHERQTRRRNLVLLMTGLFLSRSVHLSHIVRKWPVMGRLASLTNRLRRLLDNPRLDVVSLYKPVARLLIERFTTSQTPLRLILDVTKLGRAHRLLSVSLAYRRRALPLGWSVHQGAKGSVSIEAQKALLKQIQGLIPSEKAVVVLGDSAFGQVGLMHYLSAQGWSFVLRCGGHCQVRTQEAAPWQKLIEMELEPAQTRYVGSVSFTEKHAHTGVYLVMHWAIGEAEPWYLITSDPVSHQTLRLYGVRMWTEELYGDLKGHGFDLEATHLADGERLSRLVLGVCLVYVWLIVLGARLVKQGLRYLVDRRARRDKSYFRIGWDYLEHRLRLGEPIPISFLVPI